MYKCNPNFSMEREGEVIQLVVQNEYMYKGSVPETAKRLGRGGVAYTMLQRK